MEKNIRLVSRIKVMFSLRQPSLIYIILPYFSLHFIEIFTSPFYNTQKLFFLIVILLLAQFSLFSFYNSKRIILQFLSPIILVFTFFLFYGYSCIDLINQFEVYIFKDQILRGRNVLVIFLLISMAIEFLILLYKKSFFYYQNIFFFIFFLVTAISSLSNKESRKNINSFKNNILQISSKDSGNKPIILIIADEYNSPVGIYNYKKDSSVYGFSNDLKNDNWIAKNAFYSFETSTIHCLSSLFNFNLSHNSKYAEMSIRDIGTEKLLKSSLNDSLRKKNISIVNYGIFDLGTSKPITRLYYYPKNLSEQILYYSAFPIIFQNTGSFEMKGFQESYYPMEEHNKWILNNLTDSIKKLSSKNTFIYVHLYMPHGPMVLSPEFNLKKLTTDNYIAFWKFSNNKIKKLISSIIKNKDVRIILTGDHGFRRDKLIDPHNTFAAFYGFEKSDVDKIQSVQDLGSLINGYFK